MSKKKPERPAPESLGLPSTGVESHAHLDGSEFDADREAVLDRARAAGVAQFGNVFLGPEKWRANRHLFAQRPEVFFLLGIHPCEAQACDDAALAAMRGAFAQDDRLRAVGEIGLDFYWDECPPDIQRAAFRAQLAMAREVGRPVVIHSRDAFDDTMQVLEEEGFSDYPLLWHCFGGDAAQAARIVAHGWHVSLPGPVSYPANEPLREAARTLPLDRLLLETDCPYLSPVPYRGKRNEPAYMVFTAQAVAQARGMDVAELWTAAGGNARRFFGL
ncbi:TatD family hydrolase [Nitratidesulfovibrio liaohensis]|uniref:TatD family hydrolase n=1 Tax=Nitratidesulfovibrio liaohensis TaxID=2604158 RepID=UPI00141F456F|nr:TatD family hydrolase [Nitratidesulfovibrio liaohensis]NHZ46247.1 TatD family deoxyribonuclease [Nitratidesulfovibrio liaohensis]